MGLSTKDLDRVNELTKDAQRTKAMIKQIGALTEYLIGQEEGAPNVGFQVSPANEPPGLFGIILKAMEGHGDSGCDCPTCVEERANEGKPTDRARFYVEPSTAIKMLGVAHAAKQLELTGILAELSSMGIDFENETTED